jgi:predicted DNA-binding protein
MQLDKITSIRLYSGDNAELQKIADIKGLDRADIIRAAVKSYIQEFRNQIF